MLGGNLTRQPGFLGREHRVAHALDGADRVMDASLWVGSYPGLSDEMVDWIAESIRAFVALAVLMPIVASMGGNAGTQALTVTVRAIATRSLGAANVRRFVLREGLVGLCNGLAFAAAIGLIAGLFFQDVRLGAVIAAAMVVEVTR